MGRVQEPTLTKDVEALLRTSSIYGLQSIAPDDTCSANSRKLASKAEKLIFAMFVDSNPLVGDAVEKFSFEMYLSEDDKKIWPMSYFISAELGSIRDLAVLIYFVKFSST